MEHPVHLSTGELHLYAVDLSCSPSALTQAKGWLSAEETARMEAFHFPNLARRFAVSHAVLRMLLENYTGIPGRRLVVKRRPAGKPELESPSGLHFNLSASADLAVYGFSLDGAVGVDVEQIRPFVELLPMARTVLTAEELRELLACPEQQQLTVFLRFWTRKEACLKAAGVGLSVDASTLDCRGNVPQWAESASAVVPLHGYALDNFDPARGYAGAYASTNGVPLIRFLPLALESLFDRLK